jgi:protein-S-isoprenylcysteine O-methyltransferase Ste14
MSKLSFLGIGPKIATVLLPWLAFTITLSCTRKELFIFSSDGKIILLFGIILMLFGLIFYFSTIRLLLNGLKQSKLITTGAYSLCQNPLYSAIILFIIPALSLLLNSWLILTSSLTGYVMLKIFIRNEYKELEILFGDQYIKYKNETPEFFPFPVKKWFSKN